MTPEREGGIAAPVDPPGQVPTGAPESSAGGADPVAGSATSPGLVHIGTSDTLEVDRRLSRVRRMHRSVITSARLIEEDWQEGGFRYSTAMLTLTYRDSEEWSSRDVTGLIKRIREHFRRRRIRWAYAWVMELTKRNRPHFHIILWMPLGVRIPKPDKQGWWIKGMTKIELARRPVGYLAKYCSKGVDAYERIPQGARLFGAGGLKGLDRVRRRWWLLPKYVREYFPEWADDVIRAIGGGWVSRKSGERLRSQYHVIGFRGQFVLLRLRCHLNT